MSWLCSIAIALALFIVVGILHIVLKFIGYSLGSGWYSAKQEYK